MHRALIAAVLSIFFVFPSLAVAEDAKVLQAAVAAPIATGASSIRLKFDDPIGERSLAVEDSALKAKVVALQSGDVILVNVDNAGAPAKLVSASVVTVPIGRRTAALFIVGSAVALLALIWLVMQASPIKLVLGADNRYSKSQLQLASWFLAVFAVYMGTVCLRAVYLGTSFFGGVNISQNLLAVTGMSAFTFAAAKAVTSSKTDADPAQKPAAAAPAAQDLFKNDSNAFDLGDTQMLVIVFVAIAMFLVASIFSLENLPKLASISLPDIDDTLLSAFGIGQGAYLVKKAASKPGQG